MKALDAFFFEAFFCSSKSVIIRNNNTGFKKMSNLFTVPKYFIASAVLFLITLSITLLVNAEEKEGNIWVSTEERVKIWDAIAGKGNYMVSANGLEATFSKDEAKWTIVGANAPIVTPTVYPTAWPVKGDGFEVLVVPQPIANYKILPFTALIENAVKSNAISIVAARDSYEPASLVLRSGDIDIKSVTVEVTDLAETNREDEAEKATITKNNIDIRVVKCWYQAGIAIDDVKHKLLTPELLLHDDSLIVVDYDRQVNIIKNLENINDTDGLRSFVVPKNQNKQIWLTVYIGKNILPGKYSGKVRILVGGSLQREMELVIDVLPSLLPAPMLDYALYYEGHISKDNKVHIGSLEKSEEQIAYELLDMKEHGLTNATLWHQLGTDKSKWDYELNELRRMIELRKAVGWGGKPLLYLDWRTSFKDDLKAYTDKVRQIVELSGSYGIKDVYIYGVDEKKGQDLLALRPLYKAVHEGGAKNFVACSVDFLIYVPDILDMPVLPGKPNDFIMDLLHKVGINVWSYLNPQAGLEEPDTYRKNYGIY